MCIACLAFELGHDMSLSLASANKMAKLAMDDSISLGELLPWLHPAITLHYMSMPFVHKVQHVSALSTVPLSPSKPQSPSFIFLVFSHRSHSFNSAPPKPSFLQSTPFIHLSSNLHSLHQINRQYAFHFHPLFGLFCSDISCLCPVHHHIV